MMRSTLAFFVGSVALSAALSAAIAAAQEDAARDEPAVTERVAHP